MVIGAGAVRWVTAAVLVVVTSLPPPVAGPPPGPATACDRSRRVHTESWGIIADGPAEANYTQNSHCEWLIKAKNASQFINLKFQLLRTECSYDYVFVYDGDSFNAPLLGSFSGKTQPQTIIASSGFMLILLYSDTNYVLDGFRAEYSISECPGNCSGHGDCIGHKCVCQALDEWGGRDCSQRLCPDQCHARLGHGRCQLGQCHCSRGYSGRSCSLHYANSPGNRWHWLYEGGMSPRAAHSAIYSSETDSLYIFGGYDLNHVLGDLVVFRFNTSSWEDEHGTPMAGVSKSSGLLDSQVLSRVIALAKAENVKEQYGLRQKTFLNNVFFSLPINNSVNLHYPSAPNRHSRIFKRSSQHDEDPIPAKPSARYSHAACNYKGGFLMYGGRLADGSLSDELWLYEVGSRRWSLRATASPLRPPPLARHTLTLADDGWVYVVGGSNPIGEFSSAIYRIRLHTGGDEEWLEVKPRGGKPLDVRIVAHTCVYNAASHSLLVYGGILANVARFSTLSDRMFSFSLRHRHWAELHYPRAELRDSYVPQERAFHSASVMGNYLIVFGGYSHRHNREEICYDNQLYLYHMGCHTWVNHEILGSLEQASQYPKDQGVFAHGAAVRNGNTLLIVGGYHGNVNADLLAFTLPPSVASHDGQPFEPQHFCSRHQSLSGCTANPECGWCSVDSRCYGRTLGINCTTNLQTTRCPGVCPALADCHGCLLHGDPAADAPTAPSSANPPPPPPSVAHKLHLGQCTWCVQNARCHHKDDNFGVCGLREDTPSQIAGWWGDKGTEVMNADTCRLLDRRPGLTFIIYKSPMNWTQPDYVSIVNATTADFGAMLGRGLSRMEQAIGGELTGRLMGFLRPPPVWDSAPHQQLRICVAHASAVLRLAHNGTTSPLEVVGNLTAAQTQCVAAQSSTGVATTLLSGRYLIDFEAKKSPLTNQNAYQGHHNSKMELLHNRTTENPKMFTFEYLEPYESSSNGSCDVYKNCLHCLSDSQCGWCEQNARCFSRQSDERLVCQPPSDNQLVGDSGDSWQYLNLVPAHCANCSNYVSCEACVGSHICEWWPDEAKCSRKWRSKSAVKELEECPAPCYRRSNCSQCLDGTGRCVWCESTQECFTFAVYTSQYQFGMCREWLDQGYQSAHAVVPRNESRAVCDACARHTNCSACLRTLGCGWCYDLDNPIQGVCTPGDFSRSYVADSCSAAINRLFGTRFDGSEVSWSYAQCPDVDECGLGLHDCHKEAKCTNTHGSYSCQCRRGFIGDGKHSCTETCYNKCINGYCSGSPHYRCKCDQGWTGDDCSTNCGCNNHSTCSRGVGLCDECHEWTTGDYCQFCKAGSYGNATSVEGCKGCNCNDHGNASLGVCDTISGQCFCQDNTEGPACSRCKKDYYGDPRRGGTCYYQCMARGILTRSEQQGLGSRLADTTVWESRQGRPSSLTSHSLARECLWIVSPHKLHNKSDTSNIIQLTIDKDIQVPCLENSVYIYDGLPDFVSLTGSHQSHVLGVFCSQDTQYPITVEAKSGILTVHYKQGGHISEGFNATVSVLSCPNNCPPNRECRHGVCVCPEGTVGTNCSDLLCPNNCSAHLKQGNCDKGYGRCLCSEGWGGAQCETRLTASQLVSSELFNSAHLADHLDHLRKMLPRFGHSLLADRRGSLWLFGGYSLSHGPLNDIRLFDTKNNTWMQITIDSTSDVSMPEGRYFHAAEIVHSRREIFVYGGLAQKNESIFGLANNTLSDFWKFSLKNSHWVNIKTHVSPPPLAGHTMTLRREGTGAESLVLIGGFSPRHGFLDVVWEFDLLEADNWTVLPTTGYRPLGICGHSTVYHAPSKSFYVFGGMVYGDNHTYISDKLYALHYPSRTWTRLPAFDIFNHPIMQLHRGRFLHTAVTTDDYMLVFGGRVTSIGSQHSLIAYSYNCNQWVPLSSKVKAHLGVIDAVGSLPPATYAHAMTMDVTDEQTYVYIMGGFTGGIQSRMTRITLPPDLCSLWSGKSFCRLYFGCMSCTVSTPEGNITHCYSSWRGVDPCAGGQDGGGSGATKAVEPSRGGAGGISQGCNSQGFTQRTCEQYRTCTDCLARWPTHWNESQGCKWCWNCGGGGGHCALESASCDKDGGRICYDARNITDAAKCPGNECAASDCDKCLEHDNCVWTRQVATPSGGHHNHQGGSELNVKMETHDWGCHPQDALGRLIGKSRTSGGVCPPRCSQFVECDACLTSQGAEGGWHECGWSTRLNECISPSYQPLYCAGGVCGLVLAGGHQERCPQACSSYKQCSSCLKHAHCGWCSLNGVNVTGEGVCTEGSLERPASGPKKSTCDKLYVEETRTEVESLPREANFSWHYVQCPPENECLNHHHNCDPLSEQCVDLDDGYRCDCGKGYRSNGADCVPVCSQGCVRGACISPDECRCDFGYVGANCSIQCQCNGHSQCAGPDRLDVCLQCHNNTLGSQCQRCKPLFVGSPLDNGVCVPCSEYCYGHTNICINSSITDFPFTQSSPVSEIEAYLQEGPTAHARCVWCGNKTTGERCEDCIDGNFRGQYDQTMSCRPCECHGHGDTCDPVTGEQCNCGNNTESDASCQAGSKSMNTHSHCWSLQCSKCRESYMGTPTEGHQCYKQMTVDFKFCLDAKLIDECRGNKQKPLNPGQTVFFVVQPKFMNVDIRVTVDVTLGGLDLFLSPRDDTFIVEVNSSTGTHSVHIDPRYKKSEDAAESELENATMSLWHAGQGFPLDEREAKGPTTFVTVGQRNSLLFVRNLTDRLVLTLPQDKHDLSSTRFYVALTAVGRGPAYGTVFFRQDQLHIDLFVFFSVFFSCFFLFLAACVVAWKAKQAADVRRARRRHVVEMLHMAKRPFASVTLLLDDSRTSPSRVNRRTRNRNNAPTGDVRPVAIEPTDDGVAAVSTVFIKLPGGRDAPVKLALASTLMLLARVYPANNRAFLRRRSSHS
ncbi:multiple epidermal growth factor-like domains protein 8 isoform X2 [Nilaparvata lugens]|uniref:multiple epidermal growth factor-like domains protein 8 isoform X2 n=1 Tax=Nilaparvata lugens TaxID=108931 RepID=UPI00193E0A67|nr:multiple epidermal growth factor-like domains protein 8 isoform X2 [Nilaparvata lugens]